MPTVKIYTTPYCSYCTRAKELLTQMNIGFHDFDVGSNPELRAQVSASVGGWLTVPMIFIGDEFIGGYTELAGLAKEGRLLAKIPAPA